MHIMAIAIAATSAEKLRQIPREFWLKFALGVLILVGAVVLLRKLAHMNKAVLTAVVGLILTFIGFSWIYERNEPAWATPAVQFLAGFLPTKGKVSGSQD